MLLLCVDLMAISEKMFHTCQNMEYKVIYCIINATNAYLTLRTLLTIECQKRHTPYEERTRFQKMRGTPCPPFPVAPA